MTKLNCFLYTFHWFTFQARQPPARVQVGVVRCAVRDVHLVLRSAEQSPLLTHSRPQTFQHGLLVGCGGARAINVLQEMSPDVSLRGYRAAPWCCPWRVVPTRPCRCTLCRWKWHLASDSRPLFSSDEVAKGDLAMLAIDSWCARSAFS